LKKAALVLLFRRKVKGEAGLGSSKSAVHIPMPNRHLAPLVNIYIRLLEQGVFGSKLFSQRWTQLGQTVLCLQVDRYTEKQATQQDIKFGIRHERMALLVNPMAFVDD
jgi:hypothetical protein